ncbi:unnamed protein product [Brugia timori]|uniref:Troponin T n=1 Tax=Brugia timori TaxID=42155 RepID=A0A0R3Q3I2_9BILA|nr:unnamed protein product [Brugia timori]
MKCEERKAKIEAEKLKKDNERRKRQQMLSSQFTNMALGQIRRNFVLPEKSDRTDKFGNIVQAKQEMSMTKEQQEEAKRNYLVYVKHTMEFGKNGPKELREKIRQIHQRICKLEADKYDLEKRHERQEYDLRELNERQRQVARNKAFKKGLHPADTNSIHPPKVSIISKYDRQIDRRNFRERRAMFENKTAYPCFPNVLPPPTLYEKIILCDDKPDEPEDEDDEVDEEVGFSRRLYHVDLSTYLYNYRSRFLSQYELFLKNLMLQLGEQLMLLELQEEEGDEEEE